MHARVERWALDEVALPSRLVNQILGCLYREDRFCRGTLSICGKSVGPSDLQVPTLAIANTADEIGPLASVAPFIEKMSTGDTEIIQFPGEVGVGFQHLAILTGRRAYSQVWPRIMLWIKRTVSHTN
jgi:polyhydroxyalkanoate synthase